MTTGPFLVECAWCEVESPDYDTVGEARRAGWRLADLDEGGQGWLCPDCSMIRRDEE